ncbi:hypothetical protein ATCC90586_010110 [Pythium insidiosum]|nr:hypothetical protein ATCC90586_010110 [Pythium insidiosum]
MSSVTRITRPRPSLAAEQEQSAVVKPPTSSRGQHDQRYRAKLKIREVSLASHVSRLRTDIRHLRLLRQLALQQHQQEYGHHQQQEYDHHQQQEYDHHQ